MAHLPRHARLPKAHDQARPGAARLPGEVGIVPALGCAGGGIGAVGFRACFQDSAAVGVSAIEALAVAPGVGDVGGYVLSSRKY